MKFLKLTAIVLAFGLIFAGCSMIEVNEERDRETVIAKVGDEVILKGEFQDTYNMYAMYGYFREGFDTDPAQRDEYEVAVQELIDSLVDAKVIDIVAAEKGSYDFSLEDRKDIDEDVRNALDSYVILYVGELTLDEAFADYSEEELDVYAYENLDTFLLDTERGFTKQDIVDDYEVSKAQEVLFEVTTASVEVTEDEVKTYYDFLTENAKASYESGYTNYESDASNGDPIYYVPENVRLAQHILITIPDEIQVEIANLETAGETELALVKKEEGLREIEAAANEAYVRALAGEDFAALMEELGQDPGMETYDYYQVMNPSQNYIPAFVEGLFALENVGDITEPVETTYGYHVIKYYGDTESGPVSYDELHDEIYDQMLIDAQDAYYAEQIELWKEDINIKTYYNRAMK